MWCAAIVKCKTLTHRTLFQRCAFFFFLRHNLQVVIYLVHWKVFQSHILPVVFTMKKSYMNTHYWTAPTFPMRHSIGAYGGFTPNFTEMKHKEAGDWTQRNHWVGGHMLSGVYYWGCKKLENNLNKVSFLYWWQKRWNLYSILL